MKERKSYETVSEAVNDLQKRGYSLDMSIDSEKDCIECKDPVVCIHPGEFTIDEVYRFEGMSDPGDSTIVLAISSDQHNVKGVLVSAYGMYMEQGTSRIMDQLHRGVHGAY